MYNGKSHERNGYDFRLTSIGCPEQYDVYKGGEQVAYLRLRHGSFYVACPDHDGEIVYEAEPNGDGCFDDDERDKYLDEAVAAIEKFLEKK